MFLMLGLDLSQAAGSTTVMVVLPAARDGSINHKAATVTLVVRAAPASHAC